MFSKEVRFFGKSLIEAASTDFHEINAGRWTLVFNSNLGKIFRVWVTLGSNS